VRLDVREARRRFSQVRVARLATVSPQGLPHLVPFVFAVDGDRLYSAVDAKPKRTLVLRRFDNIAADRCSPRQDGQQLRMTGEPMRRVAVTGSNGKLGKAVVGDLPPAQRDHVRQQHHRVLQHP